MKPIFVRDLRSPGVFLMPNEIFDVIAPLTEATLWRIGQFVDDNGARFEFADDDWPRRKIVGEGGLIPNAEMLTLARGMPQAIWASFSGSRGSDRDPWIVLNAVDSSFWRIDCDDPNIRQIVRSTFNDVEA